MVEMREKRAERQAAKEAREAAKAARGERRRPSGLRGRQEGSGHEEALHRPETQATLARNRPDKKGRNPPEVVSAPAERGEIRA